MKKRKRNSNRVKNIVLNHINNNKKDYLILLIVFLIGIIIGVIFINNTSNEQKTEIETYINTFISALEQNNTVDKGTLLKDSILKNMLLAIVLWFLGQAVTLIPLIYGVVAFRGFCLGYAVSSFIAIFGVGEGTTIGIISLLFQNILFIPALLAISISGIKLYKSIMKDRRKENIKIEIYRHVFFSLIMLVVFIMSSFVEVYVSSNLLEIYVKYI